MLICHTKLQFQKNNKSIEINIYTEIKDSASEMMKFRGLFVVAFSMRKPPVLPGVNKKALANKTSEKWKQDIGGDIKEDV